MPQDTATPTAPTVNMFTRKYYGYFGMLGEYETKVKYLQSSLTIQQLDDITLVDKIEGSNEWPVRQLFQRGVNERRVKDELCEYFIREDQQKFFNPLTIAVIPMEKTKIATKMVEKGEYDEEIFEDDNRYKIIINEKYYKIRIHNNAPQFSEFLLNPDKVKLVALDGQHRLSALKSLKRRYLANNNDHQLEQVNFKEWSIPIILIIFPVVPRTDADILKSMRDVFVTINKQAKEPTRAQNILLDDFDVNSICTQEFLDLCHRSASSNIPLLFFDWMGARELLAKDDVEISFMDVEELYELHDHYFITHAKKNETLTKEQRVQLNVEEVLGRNINLEKRGWDEDIRKCYQENCMMSINNFFSEFLPTKKYIKEINKLKENADTSYKQDALYKLKFGMIQDINERTEEEINGIKAQIKKYHDKLNQTKDTLGLFQFEIGLRGVLNAFRNLKEEYIENNDIIPSYNDYMSWFLKHINKIYSKGILGRNNELLHLIAVNKNKDWGIVNYKHSAQSNRFGAYCAFFICAAEFHKTKDERWEITANEFIDILKEPLWRAYKPSAAETIDKDDYSAKEYPNILEIEAKNMSKKHLKKIRSEAKM